MTRKLNISENDNIKSKEKRRNTVKIGLASLAFVTCMSATVGIIESQTARDKKFFREQEQIMNLPGLELAEKKIRILNMSNFESIRFYIDYRKQLINEILDLGYNVVERHAKVGSKEKITFVLEKR